jgi:diguanylate cyclase (GGDEF)-like protein
MSALKLQVNHKPNLLIVDDDPADRAICKRSIEHSSLAKTHTLFTAESGDEALALCAQYSFACCLIDYNLRAENGLELLKAIRRSPNGSDAAIIIITGQGDERLAAEIMRNGAQDYLLKDDLSSQHLGQSITNAIRTSELQSQLRYLAHYDNLTGLLNRNLFMDRLKTTVHQCDRYGESCSLLYIDVDNFKQINDQYGHEVGDTLLKEVAHRLQANCRITDSTARLGGDEFAVLLTHIDASQTQTTAAKILAKVSEPITLEALSVQVSLSIGIAHYPSTAKGIKELMAQADQAMYKAKKSGKAKYYQFTPDQRRQWQRHKHLETMLPSAIDNGELQLAFQPIVDFRRLCIRSLEVLTRWQLDGEPVAPNELMDMIEKLKLFDRFHAWLINTAMAQLSQWQTANPELTISLNIPANQCHSPVVMSALQSALKQYQVAPEQIELEITETNLMKHPESSTQLLLAMQAEGIKVAIDDFGTGYSSMAYLTTLPVNTLKIDRSFFTNIETDVRNRKVVEAITALGHSLGFNVVAEGVETLAQYMMATELGCDYIQGYYFAKPMPAKPEWTQFLGQFPNLKNRLIDRQRITTPAANLRSIEGGRPKP